jgi:hypothetical protein
MIAVLKDICRHFNGLKSIDIWMSVKSKKASHSASSLYLFWRVKTVIEDQMLDCTFLIL